MDSLQQRRGRVLVGGAPRDGDEGLDLFSRRRSSSITFAASESDSQYAAEAIQLDRLSNLTAKMGRMGIDDLLDAEIGKHDYDWLLTPPGTPLFPSDATEHQAPTAAPRKTSTVRSVSTARASRLSSSQSENDHSARPVRSSSVTLPSISSTYSSHFSNNNRTSVLNTSSASVTSRPSTPGNRSSSVSTTGPSPATSSARLSTPAKTRPSPTSPGVKTRTLSNSRPSTPSARPQILTNSNSNSNHSVSRSTSRPSTPTRRAPAAAPAVVTGRSPATNGRNPGPASRPSSPGPRPRTSVRPIDLPDFSIDAPPNLKTKLPERPPSAGRTRPGMALTVRANSNSEPTAPISSNRRQSLPIVSRSKLPENPQKARLHSNGHEAISPETQKSPASEPGARRPFSKPATATESTGFGRTISNKSLDMALKHMDIRQSMGGARGASLFPHSIRSAPSKGRPVRMSGPVVPVTNDDVVEENGNCNGEDIAAKYGESQCLMRRASELDIYRSTRYDAMLLKEDSKNTNWLHSVEDRSDQSPVFDHRFEPLPEPFGFM